MDSSSNLPIYDPFLKQNIGRLTGKVILLKNGPISSVEDFFSDSDSEVSLNITRQTPANAQATRKGSSPSDLEDPLKDISTKPQSSNKIPGKKGTCDIAPFPGSRYGRRTGKDVLAGKKKLIQSKGVGNFSDFFTDTSDISGSLHPTPSQSSAFESSFSSAKESDNKEPSSLERNMQSKKKNFTRASARRASRQSNECSLNNEEMMELHDGSKISGQRFSTSHYNNSVFDPKPANSVDRTQNSSRTMSKLSEQSKADGVLANSVDRTQNSSRTMSKLSEQSKADGVLANSVDRTQNSSRTMSKLSEQSKADGVLANSVDRTQNSSRTMSKLSEQSKADGVLANSVDSTQNSSRTMSKLSEQSKADGVLANSVDRTQNSSRTMSKLSDQSKADGVLANSVDRTQNSSRTMSKLSEQSKADGVLDSNDGEENSDDSMPHRLDENSSDPETKEGSAGDEVQSDFTGQDNDERVDEHTENEVFLRNDKVGDGCEIESLNEPSDEQEWETFETGESANAETKSHEATSSSKSSEFKVPDQLGENSKKKSMTIDQRPTSSTKDYKGDLECSQLAESKASESKAETPRHLKRIDSDLDFGGDVIGSLSQAEKKAGDQFFGIKKRLTFSKAVVDLQGDNLGAETNDDKENLDEFVIVENDEVVTTLTITDDSKLSNKPQKEEKRKSTRSRKTARESKRKSSPFADKDLNKSQKHDEQEIVPNQSDLSESVGRRKSNQRKKSGTEEEIVPNQSDLSESVGRRKSNKRTKLGIEEEIVPNQSDLSESVGRRKSNKRTKLDMEEEIVTNQSDLSKSVGRRKSNKRTKLDMEEEIVMNQSDLSESVGRRKSNQRKKLDMEEEIVTNQSDLSESVGRKKSNQRKKLDMEEEIVPNQSDLSESAGRKKSNQRKKLDMEEEIVTNQSDLSESVGRRKSNKRTKLGMEEEIVPNQSDLSESVGRRKSNKTTKLDMEEEIVMNQSDLSESVGRRKSNKTTKLDMEEEIVMNQSDLSESVGRRKSNKTTKLDMEEEIVMNQSDLSESVGRRKSNQRTKSGTKEGAAKSPSEGENQIGIVPNESLIQHGNEKQDSLGNEDSATLCVQNAPSDSEDRVKDAENVVQKERPKKNKKHSNPVKKAVRANNPSLRNKRKGHPVPSHPADGEENESISLEKDNNKNQRQSPVLEENFVVPIDDGVRNTEMSFKHKTAALDDLCINSLNHCPSASCQERNFDELLPEGNDEERLEHTKEIEISLNENPSQSKKRQRQQRQPDQYPSWENSVKRTRSRSGSSEKDTTGGKQKSSPLELEARHRKYQRLSTLRRSPDRRRKLSRQSSYQRKTTKREGKSGDPSTPVKLNPLAMLPCITPRSGVSFRGRSSIFVSRPNTKDDVNTPDLNETDGNMKAPIGCPSPISRSTKASKSSLPTLRKRAIMNSVKRKEMEEDEFLNTNNSMELEGRLSPSTVESSTILPSPSSTPVHYLETTTSRRRSSLFQVPDLSHKIVPPEEADEGLRRSRRTRVKRLNRHMGESIVYRRDSSGFGLVVDGVEPSKGAIQFMRKEKERIRKQTNKKFSKKKLPANCKRLSTHCTVKGDVIDSTEIPVINPDTDETVNVELIARSSSASWYGPDLNPVTPMDPIAVCLLLSQPVFGTGELHMRPFSGKEQQIAVQTLIYLVMSGKIHVTVNDISFTVQTGDDFFIPRGSWYRLQNLRKDIAKIKFLNLKDD